MGWATLTNGDLLSAAETAGVEVMLTTDRRIRYQQNLAERRIALVVVPLNNRTILMQHIDLLQSAIDRSVPGGYEEVRSHARSWSGIPGRGQRTPDRNRRAA